MQIGRSVLLQSATILLLSLSSFQPAKAQNISVRQSTESSYIRGSAQAVAARQWLLAHAEYKDGNILGDLSLVGDVTIHLETSRSGSGVTTNGVGGLPVTLPTIGNPGDSITISSCSGGANQSWTYNWVGSPTAGSWVLQSYSFARVRSCTPQS